MTGFVYWLLFVSGYLALGHLLFELFAKKLFFPATAGKNRFFGNNLKCKDFRAKYLLTKKNQYTKPVILNHYSQKVNWGCREELQKYSDLQNFCEFLIFTAKIWNRLLNSMQLKWKSSCNMKSVKYNVHTAFLDNRNAIFFRPAKFQTCKNFRETCKKYFLRPMFWTTTFNL